MEGVCGAGTDGKYCPRCKLAYPSALSECPRCTDLSDAEAAKMGQQVKTELVKVNSSMARKFLFLTITGVVVFLFIYGLPF